MTFLRFLRKLRKDERYKSFVETVLDDRHFPPVAGDHLRSTKEKLDKYISEVYPYRDHRKAFEACWKAYVRHQKGLKNYKPEIGDRVILNDRYYVFESSRNQIFTVLSEPYTICGTKCVTISGKGAYAYDGITAVVD